MMTTLLQWKANMTPAPPHKVLFQQRLGLESELTIKIPEEPYRIVLDGGPGHVAVKEGIAPQKGFSVQPDPPGQKTKNAHSHGKPDLSPAYFITLGLVFCFLFLTLFTCRKNTNKLIKAIQNNQ
jgi:hypothetical protein